MTVTQEIQKTLRVLYDPGDEFEVRFLGKTRDKLVRTFDLDTVESIAQEIVDKSLELEVNSSGVNSYLVLNARQPGDPSKYTSDSMVRHHRWLLVDVDPRRVDSTTGRELKSVSSTELEKTQATQVASQIYRALAARLGTQCLLGGDSGNGSHVIIRLPDIPCDMDSRRICRKLLELLDAEFSTDRAVVDRSTFNPARLAPCYGVWKRKGENTEDRPHRQSRLLQVPEPIVPANWNLIVEMVNEHVAACPREDDCRAPIKTQASPQLDMGSILNKRNIAFRTKRWENSNGETATLFELELCPFNEHENRWCCQITQYDNGGFDFRCHHNSCSENRWLALRQLWNIPNGYIEIDQLTGLGASSGTFMVITSSTNVEPEPITWLWDQRFVMGGLNLCAGRGGIGKSFFLCDLVARITNDDLCAPNGDPIRHGRVLFASGEDHIRKVLEPRMRSHAVNRHRLDYIEGVPHGPNFQLLDVVRHCDLLASAVEARPDTAAIVLDPISSFQGQSDSNKVAEVRQFTAALSKLGEDFDIAVLGIHHFSKGKRDHAGDAVSGSHAYRDAARSLWLFALDNQDPSRRLMVNDKSNWAEARPSGLAYRIVNGVITYEQESLELTSDDLVNMKGPRQLDLACAWLANQLASGPQPSTNILAAAAAQNISNRTLHRAKKELGIVSTKQDGQWMWAFAEDGTLEEGV